MLLQQDYLCLQATDRVVDAGVTLSCHDQLTAHSSFNSPTLILASREPLYLFSNSPIEMTVTHRKPLLDGLYSQGSQTLQVLIDEA